MSSKNIPRAEVSTVAGIVEFQHTYKLGKYLGFPLLSGGVKNSDFDYILDRINGRLAGWKGNLLNRAGRVSLAKSVITSIPTYYMQNLWIPTGVCDKIDASVRKFIWGGNSSHWVNWKTISQPRKHGGLGIRTARESNISLLGKHVWDLIHNSSKLWVQLLSAKYLQGSHVLNIQQANGASYVWRSIVKSVESLHHGFKVRLGKGEASIWFDRWLDEDYICNLHPFVHINDIHLQIKDIYYNGDWHFEDLATHIPTNIQMLMKNHLVFEDIDDVCIWGSSTSGNYSAKDAHHWLIRSHNSQLETGVNWSWIWRLKLPENIKFFLWLIWHDSLPTNLFRNQRHVSNDPSFHRRGFEQETVLHSVRDCQGAKRIWNLLHYDQNPDVCMDNCRSWFEFDIASDNRILFLVTCWIIWKDRNNEVFNDDKWQPWFVLSQIHTLYDTITTIFGSSMSVIKAREVAWSPPPENFIKLNVDGSSFGNLGRSGFGGLFRNSIGEWLSVFSGCCGIGTNLKAELLATLRGLDLAWSAGYRAILCESDSLC